MYLLSQQGISTAKHAEITEETAGVLKACVLYSIEKSVKAVYCFAGACKFWACLERGDQTNKLPN
jgi:hypothetical protein